ncbi:uncharacterized protein YegL [Breznakia pachnodae]|uniref:Uncharacterized protein YegL n=1 Tax=Breznakia pachnodae TaxID=265178 RepID=A0ABU0E999_9FIRM|nr:uncharacterized protein YegL [Breznakia pachnodae]
MEIAIVSYNSTATTTQIFTSNSTTLKSKINQITASDGTNIQAGIKTAQSLLDAETAENEELFED